jgi:hypothetical protein
MRASGQAATPADLLAIALDDRNTSLDRWQRRLLAILDDEAVAKARQRAELRRAVQEWDGRARVDSVSYRLVRAWRSAIANRALTPIFAPCVDVWPRFDFRTLPYELPLEALLEQQPLHLLAPEYRDLARPRTRRGGRRCRGAGPSRAPAREGDVGRAQPAPDAAPLRVPAARMAGGHPPHAGPSAAGGFRPAPRADPDRWFEPAHGGGTRARGRSHLPSNPAARAAIPSRRTSGRGTTRGCAGRRPPSCPARRGTPSRYNRRSDGRRGACHDPVPGLARSATTPIPRRARVPEVAQRDHRR